MMFVNPVVSFFFSCFLQRTLVGLVRDLRGIAFAFNAKTSFMMLFDWMYPFSRDTVRLLTARWTVIIFIIHHSRSENVPERRPADIQPTCPFCSEPSSSGTTTQHAPRPSSNSWPSSSTTGELSDPDVSCRGSFTSGVSNLQTQSKTWTGSNLSCQIIIITITFITVVWFILATASENQPFL